MQLFKQSTFRYRSTFTCSEEEEHCGSCEGYCGTKSPLTVTVYSSGDESGEAEQGCSRGDTVQIRNHQGHTLSIHEVKVYAKLGKCGYLLPGLEVFLDTRILVYRSVVNY